jgi:hypothetical protein
MDIFIETVELNVAKNGVHKTEDGYLIVSDKDDFLEKGVVFEFYNEENPNDPAYGVVTETEENDEHTLMYVKIDPEHRDTFNIVNGKPIMIWGKF